MLALALALVLIVLPTEKLTHFGPTLSHAEETSVLPTPTPSPSPTSTPILSKILFFGDGYEPIIHFASVGKRDALSKCPIETLPEDLSEVVKKLVEKTRDSISKMKESEGEKCTALVERLANSQANIGNAIAYQFVGTNPIFNAGVGNGGYIDYYHYQNLINFYTQQANALAEMLNTTTTMMHRECVDSLDDRIVIQRLIGQAITLGGLVTGGWYGVATATAGQLIANLPLFKKDINKALSDFQKYDKNSESISLLCNFREMRKTACSLFATEEDANILGLNLSLKSGPLALTLKTLDLLKKENPSLVDDITKIRSVASASKGFLSKITNAESIQNGSLEAFHELSRFCSIYEYYNIKSIDSHPMGISENFNKVNESCRELNSFTRSFQDFELFKKLINKSYWSIEAISSYSESLKKLKDSKMNLIFGTLESKEHFETIKKNFEYFKDSTKGNQARIEFRRLVKDLESGIIKSQFSKTFSTNAKLLKKHYRWTAKSSFHDFHIVGKRALIAMLDLCKTMDPTLVCQDIDSPESNTFHKKWIKLCVGQKSTLCRSGSTIKDLIPVLSNTPSQLSYFQSLCGPSSTHISIR